MLSRSNSNAGERLKRAKSTSSTHTGPSGLRRTQQSSDPFVTRQQAEAAAVEAYHRARPQPGPAYQDYKPVPPKLERRRSRASGRTEGGHFEEARLGRRKSTSRREDNSTSNPTRTRLTQQSEVTQDGNGEERVVTRKRSMIPPNSSSTYQYNYNLPSNSTKQVRKSKSGYTDGSPVPRHASALKERQSGLQLSAASATGHGEELSRSSQRHLNAPSSVMPVTNVEARDNSTKPAQTHDVAAVAAARDKCLQDFQQKKLRERKSFIMGPFQRRKSSAVQTSSGSGYDTALPPYNYADEDVPLPPPPPPEIHAPATTVATEKKSRNFSESLKGRFKKVFRRSSRITSEMPAQHIEGRHFYFNSTSPLSTPGISSDKQEDPFTSSYGNPYLTVPETHADNASGRMSAAEQSTTRSRVTSWTNSTVAGTWSTRPDDDMQDSADEQGRLKRSDSVSTLRKATSFFGKPIKNKLRKASKLELRSSDETAGLYSALQERIHSSSPARQGSAGDEATDSRASSAIATLPSQQYTRAESNNGSQNRWAVPTIRSVTPDANGNKSDALSPVTEVLSPEIAPRPSPAPSNKDDEQSNPTPQSQLHRRPAVKAPTPSKEQIARRIERSKNRWQSPLDELSPPAPKANRAAMEDNPYELRSLSRTLNQPVVQSDLPHHAKVTEHKEDGRDNVLSPSIYSRGTDGASPRPETPAEQGGTMITITGREVRSYSISPKKRPEPPVARPARHSQEWRRWLSNEMSGWNSTSAAQDFTLPTTEAQAPGSRDVDGAAGSQHSEEARNNETGGSISPALEAVSLEPNAQRRKTKSRRPSAMNDRYPMLDTGRTSSSETKKSGRLSSRVGSRPTTAGSTTLASESSAVKKIDADNSRPTSVMTTGRIVSKHQSTAQLRTMDGTEPGPGADTTINEPEAKCFSDPVEALATENKETNKSSYRPKSAFDLRANYKTSTNGRTKPLAVRRKPEETKENILILEDTTIQKISAGPYANHGSTLAPIAPSPTANKENTPPSEPNTLPALSSSEWLAAGTNKSKDARKTSIVHPAYRSRDVSRNSPSRVVNGGGERSPGQRMVTNWLDGKKSAEGSPAFV